MRQIEKICVLQNKYIEIFVIFRICLIIFLLIRELFIDDHVTQSNHAQLNRSSQGRPRNCILLSRKLNWRLIKQFYARSTLIYIERI